MLYLHFKEEIVPFQASILQRWLLKSVEFKVVAQLYQYLVNFQTEIRSQYFIRKQVTTLGNHYLLIPYYNVTYQLYQSYNIIQSENITIIGYPSIQYNLNLSILFIVSHMSIKDFTILAKLGQGAYSSVYKVERLADHKQYALKKVKLNNLSEKQLQNAVNQVRILASIHNENIVGYKEAFLEGKNLYIIMEFLDGGDLYDKIVQYKKSKRNFEEKQIWNVLIQITRGLKALHELKIFHRDLKSANIFLTKDGMAKLGDMNVSKIARNGLLYTQTGTPYYASPEVWKDQPYDSKSDIWSFGCIIYEMATLEPPFKAEDMEGLFEAVTKGIYSPIPGKYSKQLSGVIKLMLQQNPSNRPNVQKLLKSSLLVKKAGELNLPQGQVINSELLKTIRIPKKLNYLTDKLPKSNYDQIKSVSLKKEDSNSPSYVGRQNTLPKLENRGARYNNSLPKRERKPYKPQANHELLVEGYSKNIANDLSLKLDDKDQSIQQLIRRIHHGGSKSTNQGKYQSNKIKYKPLPPLRRR